MPRAALAIGFVLTSIVVASCNHPHRAITSDAVPSDAGPPLHSLGAFNGPVSAVVHAGTSWYVGGSFTRISPYPANGIEHLDEAANPTGGCFDVLASANNLGGTVRVVALGEGVVYVAGSVTIAGAPVSGFFKLDPTTCTWDPQFQTHLNAYQVNTALVSGDSIYVGGMFTFSNGCPYGPCGNIVNLVKLDARTGSIDTTFSPPLPADNGVGPTFGGVSALALANGSLYVVGSFSAYRGVADSAYNLAKVDAVTGDIDTTFSPPGAGNNGFDTAPTALAVAGNSLYVAGNFTSYRGVADSAHSIAKLDLVTGALDTTFDPPGPGANGFDGTVSALAVIDTAVYAGGNFTAYRGIADSSSSIAKLDLSTGAIDTTFSPPGAGANGFNGPVATLLSHGGALFAGGTFTSYRGAVDSAGSFAKLDPSTGVQDETFLPPGSTAGGFDGYVGLIAPDGGGGLYVAGGFDDYAGWRARHIAKLDDATFIPDTAFGPADGFDDHVDALAVSGTSLFAGGAFSTYGDVPSSANHVAKLDLASGSLDTTFSPPGTTANGFDGAVAALAVANGSLYVGGAFSAYRGAAVSPHLAKLDVNTGALDSSFQPASAPVIAALAASSTALYVCGAGKLSLASGATVAGFASTLPCTAIAIAPDEASLYVGVAAQDSSAAQLEQLDATTAALHGNVGPSVAVCKPGCPLCHPPQPPYCEVTSIDAIAISSTAVYAGYRASYDVSGGVAMIDVATNDLDPAFKPAIVDQVLALGLSGNSLFIGGAPEAAAIVDATTGAAQ